MKKYIVFYEIFGKNIKSEVSADNAEMAERYIHQSVNVHKVVPVTTKAQAEDKLDNMLSEMEKLTDARQSEGKPYNMADVDRLTEMAKQFNQLMANIKTLKNEADD